MKVYLGTASGTTKVKTAGVRLDGSFLISKRPPLTVNLEEGTARMVETWIQGMEGFLEEHGLKWGDVLGVGLAISGPFTRYGVLAEAANLPESFTDWEFLEDYQRALAAVAFRRIEVVAGNDGHLDGLAEAQRFRGPKPASVLLLSPEMGLATAFIDRSGMLLDGDNLAGMEAAHMPAPLQRLGLPIFHCGCGRDWGCVEPYTTLSGLPQYLDHLLPQYKQHEFYRSALSRPAQAKMLRSRAQQGDALALRIFKMQAQALGYHVASLAMALDPQIVVIGGGVMDPDHTTQYFRDTYMEEVYQQAHVYLFPSQRRTLRLVAATLGSNAPALGAALVARTPTLMRRPERTE